MKYIELLARQLSKISLLQCSHPDSTPGQEKWSIFLVEMAPCPLRLSIQGLRPYFSTRNSLFRRGRLCQKCSTAFEFPGHFLSVPTV